MQNNKRGQVTIFVIIGVILLLAVIIFVSIKEEEAKKEIAPGIKVSAEEIPTQFSPIKPFVDSCINKIGTEALIKIGEHGGYINPAEFNIQAKEDPTAGNAVRFSSGSDLVIPYWFYLSSDNKCSGTCAFSYGRPPLYRSEDQAKSIEAQLDKYVDSNLNNCLNNFEAFKEQGFIIDSIGKIKTTTTVAENDVVFLVDYPIQIKQGEANAKISSFYVAVPLDLKKIYEIATLLTNLETEYKYLEKDTLDLITGFSSVDGDKLPPTSNSEFKFGSTRSWIKSSVREQLQDILASYMQLLQVYGSRNYEYRSFAGNELKESLYNEGMIVPGNDAFSDVDIFFNYLQWWPIYFDLNCDGENCVGESASSSFLSFMGIQRYNFFYDLSFPVLVNIYSPSSLKDRGYNFRFFLESNIRNNKALDYAFKPLESAVASERSMLCDMDKWNSGEITIEVKDSQGTLLDDVQIGYTCAGESCFIGTTSEGTLKTKFPICINGIVSYLKEDYLGYSGQFSTKLGVKNSLSAALDTFKYKKFEIKKKKIVKSAGWTLIDSAVDLDANEQALLTLTRKGTVNEEEYQAIAELNEGAYNPEELKLVPGEYAIDIQLILNEMTVIPEDERCEDTGWGDEECYTIPQVDFENFPNGGLKLNYTFTAADLEKDTITFYAVSPDIAGIPESGRVIEDLEQMNKVEEYSNMYEEQLNPR